MPNKKNTILNNTNKTLNYTYSTLDPLDITYIYKKTEEDNDDDDDINLFGNKGLYLVSYFIVFLVMSLYMVCKIEKYKKVIEEEIKDEIKQNKEEAAEGKELFEIIKNKIEMKIKEIKLDLKKFLFMANDGTVVVSAINIIIEIQNPFLDWSPLIVTFLIFIISIIWYIRRLSKILKNNNSVKEYFSKNTLKNLFFLPCSIWKLVALTDDCFRCNNEDDNCWVSIWNCLIILIKFLAYILSCLCFYIFYPIFLLILLLIFLIYSKCNGKNNNDKNVQNTQQRQNIQNPSNIKNAINEKIHNKNEKIKNPTNEGNISYINTTISLPCQDISNDKFKIENICNKPKTERDSKGAKNEVIKVNME